MHNSLTAILLCNDPAVKQSDVQPFWHFFARDFTASGVRVQDPDSPKLKPWLWP